MLSVLYYWSSFSSAWEISSIIRFISSFEESFSCDYFSQGLFALFLVIRRFDGIYSVVLRCGCVLCSQHTHNEVSSYSACRVQHTHGRVSSYSCLLDTFDSRPESITRSGTWSILRRNNGSRQSRRMTSNRNHLCDRNRSRKEGGRSSYQCVRRNSFVVGGWSL